MTRKQDRRIDGAKRSQVAAIRYATKHGKLTIDEAAARFAALDIPLPRAVKLLAKPKPHQEPRT